jgi:protein TonB
MDRIRIVIPLILLVTYSTFGQHVDSLEAFQGTMVYLDKAPAPKIGNEKYLEWLNKNNILKYLSDTLTINDRAYVEFFVDTTGQLIDIGILRGIGAPYDKEAIRLITQHPNNWTPAEQQGKKVKTRFVLPIYFVDERPSDRRRKKRQN